MKIPFNIAKNMIQAVNFPAHPDAVSIFFNLSELKQILETYNVWQPIAANPENYGFRVYFAKYDHHNDEVKDFIDRNITSLDLEPMDFYGKKTIILQLMNGDGTEFINTHDYGVEGRSKITDDDDFEGYLAINFGKICPKFCESPMDIYLWD